MIEKVDKFIFLDNVQLVKRTWQVRNRIKSNNEELFLTIPILKKKNRKDMLICNTEFNNSKVWKMKHLASIKHNYSRTKYFKEIYDFLKEIFNLNTTTIGEFNIILIESICKKIGIKTIMIRASELKGIEGKKDELLSNICRSVSCNEFLSAAGSAEYIEKNDPGGAFIKNGIDLFYHNYAHPKYDQIGEVFIPYLGIIDLLFNVGFNNALKIIRDGDRKNIPYLEYREKHL